MPDNTTIPARPLNEIFDVRPPNNVQHQNGSSFLKSRQIAQT